MASSSTDLITELYVGYFNRAPDPAGLAFWSQALNDGVSFAEIANHFANSNEFIAIYPGLGGDGSSYSSFVTEVYNNVLNRNPDAAGLSFWTEQLQSGAVTPASFIVEVETSVHMQLGTADAMTLANKVIVGEDYASRIAAANVAFTEASARGTLASVTSDPASVATGQAVTTAFIGLPVPPDSRRAEE
jgi:hypothetical protein